MKILGPDSLVFGVDDVAGCAQYFTDYGLTPLDVTATGGRFEAVDGTSIVIARRDDPSLPAPMETGTMLRKTTYGVADRETLDAIALELGRDREVKRLPGDASPPDPGLRRGEVRRVFTDSISIRVV